MNSNASAPAGGLFFVRQRRGGSPKIAAHWVWFAQRQVWLAATLGLACGSSDPTGNGGAGSGAIDPIAMASAGTGGTPGVMEPAQEPATPPPLSGGAGGTEANPEVIGLAGSGGPPGSAGTPGGAQASAGTGGGPTEVPVPADCDVPPAASPLVGWAAAP